MDQTILTLPEGVAVPDETPKSHMTTVITRLTVQGFKSFRRRVVIPFYPGFTAIVGENGAGKSNIFDAIAFVMGRRSRSLRAERVEQLLFAPPRGEPAHEAQVTLALDNRFGTFNELLAEPAEEVVLSRHITPTSSTYRLQGRVCAARTVEALLSAANIDPGSYNVVEQGMVIDVLERSPRRRREILDEAAGIAAYEERKAQAIGQLGQVKERLNTSRILLAERRRRLVELHREREGALEHRELTKERERLAATIRFRHWEQLSGALARASARAERVREEVEALAAEVDSLDREVEARERLSAGRPAEDGEATELIRRVERLRGELGGKEAEARALEREIASLRETISELGRLVASPGRPPEAVAKLLGLGWEGILGTVGRLCRPREGLELALETALGGHAHDLVVDTRDLALKCVGHLKEQGIGRARFLPLDKLSPPSVSPKARAAQKLPGILGFALELVDFPPRVRPAVAYVLADTVVAESLQDVRELSGVRVVTLDGDLLERGGAIVGGSPRTKRAGPDLAPRRAHLGRLEEELKGLRREIERTSAELTRAEAELHEHAQAQAQAAAARSSEEAELLRLRERRKEVYPALERRRAALSRCEREAAELSGQLAALGEVPEPLEPIPGTAEVLQARLHEVERRLGELGPVNLRAPEEYDAFLSEFQLWKERVEQLGREKEEIERFIGEVERRKREKFFATMEAVSISLSQLFQRLFGGGEAGLKLAEEGNIDSGLLVHARPPGKEPRLLDALSGGEKTLVAIAFILALATGRPTPFYLLDEVDAALDLANSERLAGLLREFARESQVIVISHNEEVVRYADRVYGVTIRDGASEVVALELRHNGRA
jgi:chromosome segregation protein